MLTLSKTLSYNIIGINIPFYNKIQKSANFCHFYYEYPTKIDKKPLKRLFFLEKMTNYIIRNHCFTTHPKTGYNQAIKNGLKLNKIQI